jgi:hypothetical protein
MNPQIKQPATAPGTSHSSTAEGDLTVEEARNCCEQALRRVGAMDGLESALELRRYLPGSPVPGNRQESAERLQLSPNGLSRAIARFRIRFLDELAEVAAERIGSPYPHPALDSRVRAERERILLLVAFHDAAPAAPAPSAPDP